MKKKIITFMLALVLVIPCIFALASCDKPCNHLEATHGLCECGHYAGTTLTVGTATTFDGVENQKSYFRYTVEQYKHYQSNLYFDEIDDTITQYAKIDGNWTDVTENRFFTTIPDDGYIYLEITPVSSREIELIVYVAVHSTIEHGLCECGAYLGTTLTIGEETTFDGIKDETHYFRYAVKQGQHYTRSLTAFNNEIKLYAKYGANWSTVNVYSVHDVLPVDGYIYVEIKPTSTREIAITMSEAPHANAESAPKLTIEGNATEDTEDLSSKSGGVCIQLKLDKGFVYEIEAGTEGDSQVCISLSNVYANDTLVQTTQNQGKLILDLTNATENFDGYLHAYINSQDANFVKVTKQA